MFEGIKKLAAKYFLKKEIDTVKRQVKVFNSKEADSIGILFNAGMSDQYEQVKKYSKALKDSKKKVKILGYFDVKKLHEVEYSKLDYDFFTRKQVNWYYKPGSPFITNFINTDFDILINFSMDHSYPLEFITAASKAKFKVGRSYSENYPSALDMMISIQPNETFYGFMKHIDHYLGIINTKN